METRIERERERAGERAIAHVKMRTTEKNEELTLEAKTWLLIGILKWLSIYYYLQRVVNEMMQQESLGE